MAIVPEDTVRHIEVEAVGRAEAAAARSRARRRSRSSTDVRNRRKRIWTYGLLVVSTMLMVHALIGEKGYLANLQARREFREVSESLRQLKAENDRLADQVRRLKTDPEALEHAARQELGMIMPGETLIRIRDRPARD